MVLKRISAPLLLLPLLFLPLLFLAFNSHAQDYPVCVDGIDPDGDGWGWENFGSCRMVAPNQQTTTDCIDTDGDGWGWDGSKSCRITPAVNTQGNTNGNTCIDTDGDGYGWDGTKTCLVTPTNSDTYDACIDTDGDGYGWDGSKTCSVTPTNNTQTSDCIDTDGDGYGWDGTKTCLVAPTNNNPVINTTPVTSNNPNTNNNSTCIDPDGDGYGFDGTGTCIIEVIIPQGDISGVTDVVLMMGQSNALGEDTQVDLSQDDIDNRVIVWTQFNDWQVGNLCTQKWQKAWFPWRGGTCSNHPAFQIAKHIVELDGSRKVAVIPTGTAGKPIRWWDANGIADLKVNATVQVALASLGKSKVDLIAWSQGEADSGNEQAWFIKLNDLISRLRQRPWFDATEGQFIAQETKWSSVNEKVRDLASDGDPLTDWVQAEDQPTKDGVHWSAPAIRTIAERFARKYVY